MVCCNSYGLREISGLICSFLDSVSGDPDCGNQAIESMMWSRWLDFRPCLNLKTRIEI